MLKVKWLPVFLIFMLFLVMMAACSPGIKDGDALQAAQETAEAAAARLAEAETALADAQAKSDAAQESNQEALEKVRTELESLQKELDEARNAADEAQAILLAGSEKEFLTWFQYDETNEDPSSDERVGNEYLRNTIPQFNAAFEGKWKWVNRFKPWDRMYQELVSAVIAGNTVPDIIEMRSSAMNLVYRNGAVQDLRPWAEQQSWYADMDPSAMASCTLADGGLYCIPFVTRPYLVFVWADYFPNGYPKTPEEFIAEADRLKSEGVYAWTYFGSTAFSGNGTPRMVWSLVSSFGGKFDDGNGHLYLTAPETIAAIEFLRMTVKAGYNPETVFAGGFVEEDSFKDASAASIPTGLFGYRYINPLTAPDGTKYSKGNAEDMIDAISAGDVILATMFAPEGKTPGCGIDIQGVSIPTGAKNVEAAYDFINWIMTPEQNPAYVLGPGAGFPANTAMLNAPELDLPFYRAAESVMEKSVCTTWFGSLERREEAAEIIMNAVYKIIKEDPDADIFSVLSAAEAEYNRDE